MRKYVLFLALFGCFVLSGITATAEETQQKNDTADETIVVKKKDLPPNLVADLETKNQIESTQKKIESYGKWVGVGKEVGVAVNESLSALTTQADTFSKTGVGKFAMFLVAWKVLGRDFIGFIIGVPLLLFGTIMFVWSYRRMCLPYSVLTKINEDKSKEYTVVNKEDLGSNEVRLHFVGVRWAHILAYFAFVIFIWTAVI